MLNSLLKAAEEVGRVADQLQKEDPTLDRLSAVSKAMDIVQKKGVNQ